MDNVLLSKSIVHRDGCITTCRESRCGRTQHMVIVCLSIHQFQSFYGTWCIHKRVQLARHRTPDVPPIPHGMIKELATRTWPQGQRVLRYFRKLNRLYHIHDTPNGPESQQTTTSTELSTDSEPSINQSTNAVLTEMADTAFQCSTNTLTIPRFPILNMPTSSLSRI